MTKLNAVCPHCNLQFDDECDIEDMQQCGGGERLF